MTNVEAAKAAIDKVFSDTTVSLQQVLSNLEDLHEHLAEKVTLIKEDLKDEESTGEE